jgi:hypothetical protein
MASMSNKYTKYNSSKPSPNAPPSTSIPTKLDGDSAPTFDTKEEAEEAFKDLLREAVGGYLHHGVYKRR